MIQLEQTMTPYLTSAKSFVHTMINLHLFKEFLVKYWILLLISAVVITVLIYKIRANNAKEAERLAALAESIKEVPKKETPLQDLMNKLQVKP